MPLPDVSWLYKKEMKVDLQWLESEGAGARGERGENKRRESSLVIKYFQIGSYSLQQQHSFRGLGSRHNETNSKLTFKEQTLVTSGAGGG